MRVMHSSDWHLGCRLYGQSRDHEFSAFFSWLLEKLEQEKIDALLVAGDIFDNSVPSNRAQQLYYDFLRQVSNSSCRHVVIIGGNHDSPSFLEAPRELLKTLNVHVIGSKKENVSEELICLYDDSDQLELLVAAVPYLRDRDVRSYEAGENYQQAAEKLREGIEKHYREIAGLAAKKRREAARPLPLIGMGHLYTQGGLITEGDGVRQLYVGTLAHIESGQICQGFDYLALGHLHVPQIVDGNELVAYSGSPLAMGFNEAKQQKSLRIIEFNKDCKPSVELLEIPAWQRLERIHGDWTAIESSLKQLKEDGVQAWLEIIYDSDELCVDLREKIDALLENTGLLPLRISNKQVVNTALQALQENENLKDLEHTQVFQRLLENQQLPAEQNEKLLNLYQILVTDMLERDENQ